jgi:proteasome lid subunit RPN8/RPN11
VRVAGLGTGRGQMVSIPAAMVDEMRRHAELQAPAEACALIGGAGEVCKRLFIIDNVDDDPRRYEMDSAQLYAAVTDIEAAGSEMVAIFHSHPASPAWPSRTDIELAFYAEAVYIIMSLLPAEQHRVRAFRIVDGVVSEQQLIVEG